MILTFLFGGVLPNSYFFNRKRLTSYQICWPSLAYFWAISYKVWAIMGFINLLWAILATFYGDLRKKKMENSSQDILKTSGNSKSPNFHLTLALNQT